MDCQGTGKLYSSLRVMAYLVYIKRANNVEQNWPSFSKAHALAFGWHSEFIKHERHVKPKSFSHSTLVGTGGECMVMKHPAATTCDHSDHIIDDVLCPHSNVIQELHQRTIMCSKVVGTVAMHMPLHQSAMHRARHAICPCPVGQCF